MNVLKAHGRRHPELYDVYKLFGQLSHEMEPHLIREETELFPAIANSEAKEHCQALVHILEEEHEAAGDSAQKAPPCHKRLQRPLRRMRYLPRTVQETY